MQLRRRLEISSIVALALSAAWSARASDIIVTRYDDPIPGTCSAASCSLREAVLLANQDTALDTILLSAGTYTLTIAGTDDDAHAGDLDLTQDVQILGAGATMTRVDGGGIDRVFEVVGSTTNAVLEDLTIQGGAGVQGAGILVDRGTATINRCEIRDNTSPPGEPGAGITAELFASVVVRKSTIAGNSAGAIAANQSSIELDDVTVDGNALAIQLQATGGGSVTCTQCTIVPPSGIGAVQSSGTGSTVSFGNSIVIGSCFLGSGGVVTSNDGNLESPGDTCGFTQVNDQTGVATLHLALGNLTDNGGPTRTRSPGATSFALDQAATPGCLSTDQRGLARPVDGDGIPGALCDVGAVEASTERPDTPIFDDGLEQGSAGAWSVVKN